LGVDTPARRPDGTKAVGVKAVAEASVKATTQATNFIFETACSGSCGREEI
jgi:hypothetical protein